MGIITVEMYTAKCDVCGVTCEFGDFSCLGDESSVREDASENGWHFESDETCYCEDCHSLDEDGNVVVKQKV